MGAGAVSSAAAWCGAWLALAVSTRDPPHEQSLVGMGRMLLSSSGEGGGGVVSVMWQVNEGVVYLPGGFRCLPSSVVIVACLRPSRLSFVVSVMRRRPHFSPKYKVIV
jgi:hypothetical protein